VQLTLVAEVATAYLTVRTDQTLLDITRDTLKSQEDSYALTQKLFSGGTTTELALRQAEITVDTARANLAQYNRQLAQDRDALQLLLGAPIPDGIDFSGGLDRGNMVAELEEGIPSDVLVRRPDVLAAEHQLIAANAEIGAARAAFLPAISLTGNFGTESTQLSGLFKGGSRAWTFSPQISVPIFAGGANVANLEATKLARDTAVAQYEKAIQTAFREVADALVARGTLDEQLAAQQALVTASAAAYRLADMRYRGGVDSYLSALDAQRTLYSAQQQLQTVRFTRLQNLVTLYKALGGGLREHTTAARTTLSLRVLRTYPRIRPVRFELGPAWVYRSAGNRGIGMAETTAAGDQYPTTAAHSWIGELLLRLLGAALQILATWSVVRALTPEDAGVYFRGFVIALA